MILFDIFNALSYHAKTELNGFLYFLKNIVKLIKCDKFLLSNKKDIYLLHVHYQFKIYYSY